MESLDASQRAILVLTEDIFEEEWNIFTLDVALKNHRDIVIIKRQEVNFQRLLGGSGNGYRRNVMLGFGRWTWYIMLLY